MKKLVISALIFFPAINLTAASFNHQVEVSGVEAAGSKTEDSFDHWFADYDMYCANFSDLKLGQKSKLSRLDLVKMADAVIRENSDLTERLLSLRLKSEKEVSAREKFFAQLRLERASMTVQMANSGSEQRAIASNESPLLAKATENRKAALRSLASASNEVSRDLSRSTASTY